ncbi:MAG TPA: hypothetical protein VF739_11785 [Ktedonobacterales bacterium]
MCGAPDFSPRLHANRALVVARIRRQRLRANERCQGDEGGDEQAKEPIGAHEDWALSQAT